MTSADDRRKKIRVPVQSKIRHSQYQVLGTPIFQENSSIDLSSGGIAFRTEREYQKGNLVLLEVQVEEESLKLLVCVAWVKPKNSEGLFEIGTELIAVDPVHKRKMQSHLNRLITEVQKKNRNSRKKVPATPHKRKAQAAKPETRSTKKKSPLKIAKKTQSKAKNKSGPKKKLSKKMPPRKSSAKSFASPSRKQK